jgi:hypothetical protein
MQQRSLWMLLCHRVFTLAGCLFRSSYIETESEEILNTELGGQVQEIA